MRIHLGSAPEQYDRTDQNVMRRTIENVLLDGLDRTASGIGDIAVTDPYDGQFLVYDTGQWVNEYVSLNMLYDVDSLGAVDGEYLGYDGSEWVNKQIEAEEVDYTSPYIDPDENVQDVFAFHASAGHHTGGVCTAGTAYGDVDISAGTGWLRPTSDSPILYGVEWAAETISITQGEFTSIGIGWVGGVPRVVWKYGNAYWNNQDEFQIGNALWDGDADDAFVFQQYSYIPNASGKIATRFLEAFDQGRAFRQGLVISDKSYGGTDRYVAMTEGILWDVFQRTEVSSFDSSPENPSPDEFFVLLYDLSIPGFTLDGPYTQWDNTVWNDHTDGTTPLKALPTDQWAVFWWTLTSDGGVVAVYPDSYQDDQASAEDAPPPDHLTDEIESQIHSKFVFQEGELNAKEVFTLWGDVGGIEPGQAPNDHGALLGLADDDHSQYLHIAVSRQVTAQHNFTVYGTGDFLNDEWDILFGDTTVNKWGAIAVGGAAFALGGDTLTSVGSPGINLEGTVIVANRGNGPQGNSEYVFGDTADEIRFGLPKSGAGLGTYNPRSMIIAGPAEFDDQIYEGSYWGFDNLPMETDVTGADLGVQHDVEVLGKIWVDTIGTSTTDGTLTFDDDVIFTETVTLNDNLTITTADGTYVSIEATGVDSLAWLALQNDAREYRLRVTGANAFDIYDVTAASTRMTMDTAGDVVFAQDVTMGALTATNGTFSGSVVIGSDPGGSERLRVGGSIHAGSNLVADGSASLGAGCAIRGISPSPAGPGLEIEWDSGNTTSDILSYDRTASTYQPLRIRGSEILLVIGGVADALEIDSAGDATFTGDVDMQALTATSGEFSGNVYIGNTGSGSSNAAYVYSYGGDAVLELDSGYDGSESQSIIRFDHANTSRWAVYKLSTGDLGIYDYAKAGNVFQIVPNASMTLNPTTGVVVGSPTGGAKGAGTLNATGLYVNGVAVAGTGDKTSLTGGTATWATSEVGIYIYDAFDSLGIGSPASLVNWYDSDGDGSSGGWLLVAGTGKTTVMVANTGGVAIGSVSVNGAGTLNVQNDIYKSGTAYTNPDYVFEHYYGQRTDEQDYEGLKSLPQVEKYLMEHLHLPRITRAQMGIFQRADTLLEKVEEVFLYLIEHEKKLDDILETINATT